MEDRTVFQLFRGEDVRYRVPIYQRHYVWDKMHWQNIWDDIEEKTNSKLKAATGIVQPVPHFTGVIVTRKNEKSGEVEIVDGQQRLTTFQIIFCAIRDICTDICTDEGGKFNVNLDSKEILQVVNELLNNPKHPTHATNPENMYKLLPTEGADRASFRKIVAGSIDDGDGGLLLKAYIHFKEEIKLYVNDDYQRIVALVQTLLFNFRIVEMTLSENDKAAKIFESLNGRGLPLTQFDRLRNNVFLRAGDERDTLYEKCWQHFNNESIWFSDEIVDDFLNNFLQAKLNKEYNPRRSLFDLYQRDYIGNLRRKLDIDMDHEDDQKLVKQEFEELQGYSKAYAEITNCREESPLWFYQFLKTDLLKITSWHPLILFLKSELRLSEENEKKIFRILESYIVRHFLCYPEIPEWIRENKHRELRLDIVRQIQGENSSFEAIVERISTVLEKQKKDWQWPDDPKVREALANMGNHWSTPLQKYILFKIEREMTDTNLTVSQLTWSRKLTREHIMPRGWENAKYKPDEKSPAQNSWPVASSDKALSRDRHVESIGNLTLLTGEANELVDTDPFANKQEFYREYSRLSITDYIISEGNWDVKQIETRAGNLSKLFCEIWPSSPAECIG